MKGWANTLQREEPPAPTTASSPKCAGIPDVATVYRQAADENFPVASWVLPRAVRADLMAIYGFARLTDDVGDEAAGDRVAMLDWLDDELQRAAVGTATHPVLRRLTPTIAAHHLTLDPFRALIEANRMDQRVHRYATFDDLVGYCRLSADPVGRLVLAVLGADTPERIARSDDVCTGLQVVEHLQDVGEDYRAGRIYLPAADMTAAGCREETLGAPCASDALRDVVATTSARAAALLRAGGPLAASLPARPRVAVAAFAAGGLAALDDIARARFDVLATACRPRPRRLVRHLAHLLVLPGAPARPGWPVVRPRVEHLP